MNDLILEQAILEKIRLLPPAPQSSAPEPTADVPKTPLDKWLWELRQQAIAAGMKLPTAEEIEQEIAEQRDRHRDLYEPLAGLDLPINENESQTGRITGDSAWVG